MAEGLDLLMTAITPKSVVLKHGRQRACDVTHMPSHNYVAVFFKAMKGYER